MVPTSHAKANDVFVTTTIQAAIRFASVWKVEKTVNIHSLKAQMTVTAHMTTCQMKMNNGYDE